MLSIIRKDDVSGHGAADISSEPLEPRTAPTRLDPGLARRALAPAVAAPASPHAVAPGAYVRRPSRFLLRFFDIYLSLYFPFHFEALRIAHPGRFPLAARPLIVVINHPSWWDPLTSILISRFFLRQADHYAPIDALSLPRNRILAGLGLFPVEQGTARGAVQFLRASQRILADENSILWLTPQGGFTDVRVRPVVLKAGLASLVKRLPEVTVLPVAYEYTYWDWRKPEALALCGEPLQFTYGKLAVGETAGAARGQAAHDQDAGQAVAAALAKAQDELAALALARSPAAFTTVMAGESDVSGFHAAWRHLLAAVRARPYRPGEADAAAGSASDPGSALPR